METAGRLAVIKVSGDPLTAAAEGLTHITNTEWQITDAIKRVLERDVTPVVEKSDGIGGWDEISYLSVNKLNSKFTFGDAGYVNTETLRVKSGNYLPMSSAAYAHEYSYNRSATMLEVTRFQDTHKRRIAGAKFGSGSLSQWDVIDAYFEDALTAREPIVLEFRAETTGNPQRLWALIESTEMSTAIESPQDEAVSFISTDDLLNLGD